MIESIDDYYYLRSFGGRIKEINLEREGSILREIGRDLIKDVCF